MNSLEAAIVDQPGLDGTVELSVSGTPVTEFVRGLGVTHQLDITIDPAVKGEVVNNFTDARVVDVLMFLCKRYDLDVEFIGSIIVLKPYVPVAPPVQPPPPPRTLSITYDADSGLVDMDLRRDTLSAVARTISQTTGANVVLAPWSGEQAGLGLHPTHALAERHGKIGLRQQPHRGAHQGRYLPIAWRGGVFTETIGPQCTGYTGCNGRQFRSGLARRRSGRRGCTQHPDGADHQQGFHPLDQDFFLYDALDKPATLHLSSVSYEELLVHLLKGTEFTHRVSEGVHLIGKRDLEGLRATEIVRLHHRPVKDVLSVIPEGIKKNITIAEFVELNGIVLSGDALRIEEVKSFLRTIDQVVPVVMIEVMLVDVNRSRTLSTGIKAGLGDGPTTTGGAVLPGVDFNLNSSSINNLINSFNGFGVFNLGNVAPDFYLSIQALESDGMLKLRSTPQLSTLNGHEATMSIGQTEYYLEVRNDLIGTQNPTVTTSQTYKPIKADLSLRILPIVSSEDMVTLEIEVNQSSFTSRIAATAPPGSVERKFSSIVRAANKDMIILGGLEEKENSKSGSGVPFLSRIPVLKWFFGSRTSKMRKSKLTIFIRPTIIY
ncbi:MAG: hypothetical protein IPH60_08690 [Flavobacteriales bacterium]|nr:hypothetical protein [Flavobacteriales bacterium]